MPLINAIISIGIFLVLQLVAAVWWAATMNTKMDFIIETSKGTKIGLDAHVTHDVLTYSTKAEVSNALVAHEKEVAMALGFTNKELSAMWKKIDFLSK